MPGNRWTKPQIESLVDQIVHLGKPLPQIDIPGKTRAAINNQRKRLQRGGVLNGSFAGRAVRPWTFPELKKLTGFTHDYGFSASFIAQMALLPGRTKDSISKMMGRHGLGNPAIKERARQAQRFDPPRREEFQRFLLGEGRLLPSILIARQWGLAQKTVTAYPRRLGIPLARGGRRGGRTIAGGSSATAPRPSSRTPARVGSSGASARNWLGRNSGSNCPNAPIARRCACARPAASHGTPRASSFTYARAALRPA